jgi:hypothetical protein
VPTDFTTWTPLAVAGDSVRVTVQATSLRITDISAPDTPPITVTGPLMLTAKWSDPSQPPDSITWTVDDSRTSRSIDATTVVAGSLSYIYVITAGSYNLRFSAVPWRNGALFSSGAYVEDFPVCTGTEGGSGTDAIDGCGGGAL